MIPSRCGPSCDHYLDMRVCWKGQHEARSPGQRGVLESEAAIASLFKMLEDSVEQAVWQEKGYKDEIVQSTYLYASL